MKIELKEITIQGLTDGFADNAEQGVVAYGGQLDIRPPYQREFIYKDAQRNAVIDSVRKDFPLNVMYWAVRDEGGYEVIDGQHRTVCELTASLGLPRTRWRTPLNGSMPCWALASYRWRCCFAAKAARVVPNGGDCNVRLRGQPSRQQ
jgi:hypothetical protein